MSDEEIIMLRDSLMGANPRIFALCELALARGAALRDREFSWSDFWGDSVCLDCDCTREAGHTDDCVLAPLLKEHVDD